MAAVGWLTERRSWDRHRASAARLALIGILMMYLPGVIWLEVAALLMREARGPGSVLPSIPMLILTVAVLAFGLPRAWAAVAAMQPENLEPQPEAIAGQPAATNGTRASPGE